MDRRRRWNSCAFHRRAQFARAWGYSPAFTQEGKDALAAVPARLAARESEERFAPEYFEALIATLAFAGLNLSELCFLRVSDLHFSADRSRAQLWVTTVEDTETLDRHELKNENRRRHVDVHPRLLLPLLSAHIDGGRAGRVFLFPMPVKRKRRNWSRTDERWRENTLSTWLRGHPGGDGRKATPGLLPKGMNAKSLRRTFGSWPVMPGQDVCKWRPQWETRKRWWRSITRG